MSKFNYTIKKIFLYILIFYFLILWVWETSTGYYLYGFLTLILTLLIEPRINKILGRFNINISTTIKYFSAITVIGMANLAQPKKDLFGLIFTSVWGILIYFIYRIVNSDKIKKVNKLKKTLKNKVLLKNKNLYYYIDNFVSNYVRLEAISNQEIITDCIDKKQIEKLQKLLETKEIRFQEEDLISLIKDNLKDKDYEKLKNRLERRSPKSLDEYIKVFVYVYGYENEYKDYYLELFEKLLIENKIHCNKEKLIEHIAKVRKDMEIYNFERKLKTSKNKKINSIKQLDYMNGYQFQSFLKTLFEKIGYIVEKTNLSHDQGADLLISKFGEKTIVQAKRHKENVNNRAIQEVTAALKHYKADKGIVVITSSFTKSAIELAESNNIELIDRKKLKMLIQDYL